jgi:oligopeptidase B
MVRGGGEKGIYWHEQGKLHKKANSFKDFAACAEYLIAQRLTHPNLLAAKGASAGGTLVAQTCLNMHPELFRACVLNVPFLDVLSTLLDESLPLTVTDHLELGNPMEDERIYRLINSYSPYENLSKREYPSTLMNVSLTDPRVPEWGTLKFIEKLRDMAETPQRFPDFGDKNIVVRLNKEGGHFGDADNEVNLAMATFEFAWLDYIMFKKHNM